LTEETRKINITEAGRMVMLNSELLPQAKYSYSSKEKDELEILPFFVAGG